MCGYVWACSNRKDTVGKKKFCTNLLLIEFTHIAYYEYWANVGICGTEWNDVILDPCLCGCIDIGFMLNECEKAKTRSRFSISTLIAVSEVK